MKKKPTNPARQRADVVKALRRTLKKNETRAAKPAADVREFTLNKVCVELRNLLVEVSRMIHAIDRAEGASRAYRNPEAQLERCLREALTNAEDAL